MTRKQQRSGTQQAIISGNQATNQPNQPIKPNNYWSKQPKTTFNHNYNRMLWRQTTRNNQRNYQPINQSTDQPFNQTTAQQPTSQPNNEHHEHHEQPTTNNKQQTTKTTKTITSLRVIPTVTSYWHIFVTNPDILWAKIWRGRGGEDNSDEI